MRKGRPSRLDRGISIALAALLAIVFGPEPIAALEVFGRHAPEVNLSAYETYSWRLPERPESHPLHAGSSLDTALREAIQSALTSRGWRQTETDPDTWLSYEGVLQPKVETTGVHIDLGPVTWMGYPESESAKIYREGLLMVELTDAESDQPVWSGWAVGVMKNPSPEKIRRRALKAVQRILATLPAQ